ncbi:acetyl-CoA synthetase-like protein [Polyplosphaeria fusca]|uniref:Acetyl-CoA synthetase-like protein n=1 Tax=Polyplosphaeria fusca TaxID=682080 RepID=A0A9P4R240_9PLEO|nr:acetyl-CoA synthetase-like protein [Polyplosphaeria fusca]
MDSQLFYGLEGLSLQHQHLVSRFGRGPITCSSHSTVHEAFESIVDSHPGVIAAKHGDRSITYGELDAAANRMAHHLIELGLAPRQRVCLVVQRSFEMLVGIFAVLKAGCQYVPIDGGVSSDQALQHILEDTRARFVLCLERFESRVRKHGGSSIHVVRLGSEEESFCSRDRLRMRGCSEDGVYAIYTSGSTGKPKGVDVSHGNVTNALLLQPANLGISIGSKVAQVLNIAFDMGAWEILACLMNGGTLYLRGSHWEDTLRKVDTLISTPSILSKFRRSSFPNIRTVVTGGEPCPQTLADEWSDSTFYYNICGPTEITILNSAHQHVPGTPLTIGKPLPNTTCYILDDEERPVPVGSKGVMWVGGAGVSRGYINLPELTATRFRADKFLNNGSLMFNTGDIVRWREDGSLEIFGRVDDQVKIKGFRVELDGVTAVIEEFPGITRACAALIDGTLHGFYTTTTFVDEHDLDNFVRHHLPYYSVPEKWHYLAAAPLTANGKVDKTQLIRVASRITRTLSTTKALTSSRTSTFNTKSLYLPATLEKTLVRDEDKAITQDEEKVIDIPQPVYSSKLSGEFDCSTASIEELPDVLPPKNGFHGWRWLRHKAFILYRRLFTFVVLSNIAVALFILYRRVKDARPMLVDVSIAFATNLTVSVLMRSEPVINLLFTVSCSVPTSFPLCIRRQCARIFHIGGIHSGCAIAAVMWFLIFTCGASLDFAKPPSERCISMESMIMTYLVNLLFFTILSTSHPHFRVKFHNAWEYTHRFGGWTTLALLWIQAFLTTRDLRLTGSAMAAYRTSPPIYLISVATAAIVFPWLFCRRVPVRSEVLSSHAVRLHFSYTTPVVGTSVRIAERPLGDWHGFATITNQGPNAKGFSLVVSNAGDFTKRTIQRAPSSVHVRGIPACGVLRIATLFKSIVLVATGSGIGPCLAVILARKIPCRILWSTPNPELTFGKEILDSVYECDPKALVWNTRTQGKPDMPLLAWRLWKESGAEAVCVISNKRFTTGIVYAMEARGIPAYGAIFDS